MKLTLATVNDVTGVLQLQHKYHVDSIKEEDRKDGFVTTPFNREQLTKLVTEEKGLFVALKDNKVVAYLMAASWSYWSVWPMFEFMISELHKLHFSGKNLSVTNSYQYGPVCLDKSVRGTGLLEQLFDFSRQKMSRTYPLLVTFVNTNNRRSVAAHTRKLGMTTIHEFEFNNNRYLEMVYDTSKKVASGD